MVNKNGGSGAKTETVKKFDRASICLSANTCVAFLKDLALKIFGIRFHVNVLAF